MLTRLCVGMLGALLLLGCGTLGATLDPWGHSEDLEEAQLRYTQFVRWGDFERASDFVDPELRDQFLHQSQQFHSVRFTEYRIHSVDMSDKESATARVSYHAYHLATLLEGVVDETQDWYWNSDDGWRVRPSLRQLRASVLGPRP